jgi:hypothetical protein
MPISKQPRAVDIFVVAEQFRAAARLAVVIPAMATAVPTLQEAASLFLPTASMVCSALSLELYFKCLIRMGRKSYVHGHDLYKLFYLIGKPTQARIKQCWQANSAQVTADINRMYAGSGRPVPKATFDFVLSASKDAFTVMRYGYQGIPSDQGWLADTVVECARNAILERNPNWERMRQIFPSPSISFGPHP